jgi:hypothetical protein
MSQTPDQIQEQPKPSRDRRAYMKAYYRRMRDAWREKKQTMDSVATDSE